MVNLSDRMREVAVVFEMLTDGDAVVIEIAAMHERLSRGSTPSGLTVGAIKDHASGGEFVDVGGFADRAEM